MKVIIYTSIFFILCLWGLSTACEQIIPVSPAENELLDGPIEGLNHAEQAQFLAGDIAFND